MKVGDNANPPIWETLMPALNKPPANRTVALLTPLVFAPLAGAISVAAAQLAPGQNIDPNALTAIFIAGATIAFGKAAQWTKGWQAFEQSDVVPALVAPAAVDDLEDEFGDEDLAGEVASGEEVGFDAEHDLDADHDLDEEHDLDADHDFDAEPEFHDEPEFLFESDDDVDDEHLAVTAGHEG